jgi:hypothetical protein
MIKKLISTTLVLSVISSSSFAITKQEVQNLINNNENAIAQSVRLKVASDNALLVEINATKKQIKAVKADIKKNSKDTTRAVIVSSLLAGGIIANGFLMYNTRWGEILGGDRAGAAMVQGVIFIVGGAAAVVAAGDATLNYTLVRIDSADLEDLEATLEQLESKLNTEVSALES